MKTILAKDNDPRILRLLRVNLERAGYHVIAAADSVTATAQVQIHRPALVVVDMSIILEGEDGAPAADSENCARGCVPVVVLFPILLDEKMLSRWDGIHVSAWLRKPFNPMKLTAIVKRLLGDLQRDDGSAHLKGSGMYSHDQHP